MSRQQRRIFWVVLLAALALSGALVLVVGRNRSKAVRGATESSTTALTKKLRPAPGLAAPKRTASRNLSLQPEAFNMSRRLGQRFARQKREKWVLVGTLSVGGNPQGINLVRKQTDDGERVEIAIAGRQASLTWDADQGALSSGVPVTENDRALIERLVLDSPDQFILAQLRGAVYQTMAQQARPAEAGGSDDYKGPLWDIVMIAEPGQGDRQLPQSPWRLYHINAATGLIDKVVSQEQGQTITAEITGWVKQGGELVPMQIIWRQGTQTVMELRLTNISHSAE